MPEHSSIDTLRKIALKLVVLPQHVLPHHLLSRAARWAAECRVRWFKAAWIHVIRKLYGVRMDEAAQPDPAHYANFDAFFTRALRAGIRPLQGGSDCVVSPVDGMITGIGSLEEGVFPQAKGQRYRLETLFAGCPGNWAEWFAGGQYASLYLAPRDYHRVHTPLEATPVTACHVPGRLYSVGWRSRRAIPRLYARNERLVLLFETAAGPMAVVMVGALLVGGLESVCTGRVSGGGVLPLLSAAPLARGAELGRFHFGSAVLLLYAPGRVQWLPNMHGQVRMGQTLGQLAATGATAGRGDE